MPWPRTSLADLKDQVLARVKRGLGLKSTPPALGNTAAISYAVAGQRYLLDEHLDWASRQGLATLADADNLNEIAVELGIAGRKPASAAVGAVTFTVAALLGETVKIPIGTLVRRSDGELFRTTELGSSELAGDTVGVAVQAVEAGADGNTEEGIALELVDPIEGIDGSLVVDDGGLTGGADQETEDALRERVLARRRNPPMGGSKHDYIAWALSVPAVTRAWCIPNWNVPNGVLVMFVCDDNPATILPSGQKVQEVRDYIEDETRMPVGAALEVRAPTPLYVDHTVRLTPDNDTVRTSVIEALQEVYATRGEPDQEFRLSWLREAIGFAPGEISHDLVDPDEDITVESHEIPLYRSTTFVE